MATWLITGASSAFSRGITEVIDSHGQPIGPVATGRMVVDAILDELYPQQLLLGSGCVTTVTTAHTALKARLAELNE